jgi:hypothetical protein
MTIAIGGRDAVKLDTATKRGREVNSHDMYARFGSRLSFPMSDHGSVEGLVEFF